MKMLVKLLVFLFLAATAGAAEAATCSSCFWIGGTGTLDLSTDSTHWSSSSGGSSCGSPCTPTSTATLTFDGSSGGGTVTVNVGGGTLTAGSIVCGAFTGTLTFSVNNNNVALSSAFNCSGSGTRTLNLGNGTWTITATSGTPWQMATTTGLTFNANSSTIVLAGTTTSQRTFAGGGLTYNVVTFSANSSLGTYTITAANTFATLNITAPNVIQPTAAVTQTVTNAFTWTGSSGSAISLNSLSTSAATISVASGSPTMTWATLHGITFSGGATFTATNSMDGGGNSGISITAPVSGGGAHGLIVGG